MRLGILTSMEDYERQENRKFTWTKLIKVILKEIMINYSSKIKIGYILIILYKIIINFCQM